MKDVIWFCSGVLWSVVFRTLALSLAVWFVVSVLVLLFFISHAICRLLTFYLSFGRNDSDRFSECMTFVIFQIRFRMVVDRHLRAWKYVITSLLLLFFTDWKATREREREKKNGFFFFAVDDFIPSIRFIEIIFLGAGFSWMWTISLWVLDGSQLFKLIMYENYGFRNNNNNNNKFCYYYWHLKDVIEMWTCHTHLTLTYLLLLFLFALVRYSPASHLLYFNWKIFGPRFSFAHLPT